jgi:hypothetical protein
MRILREKRGFGRGNFREVTARLLDSHGVTEDTEPANKPRMHADGR